jgi:hypothetical protein
VYAPRAAPVNRIDKMSASFLDGMSVDRKQRGAIVGIVMRQGCVREADPMAQQGRKEKCI